MTADRCSRHGAGSSAVMGLFVALLGFTLSLLGCDGGGSSGHIEPQAPVPPQLGQEAVHNLLELQRSAVLQEDIDRLQQLVFNDGGAFQESTFLEVMSDTFRRHTVIDLQQDLVTMQLAAEPLTVSFRETLSVEDPHTLEQRSRSVQTTWRLAKQTSATGTVSILIADVTQSGPEFQVTTHGQVQAGVPARVEVMETTGGSAIAGVQVEVPETATRTSLVAASTRFQGDFLPPFHSPPQALRVHIRHSHGQEIVVSHRYRLRMHGEGAVAKLSGTGASRLFAVVTAPDGTVWTGGDRGASAVLTKYLCKSGAR